MREGQLQHLPLNPWVDKPCIDKPDAQKKSLGYAMPAPHCRHGHRCRYGGERDKKEESFSVTGNRTRLSSEADICSKADESDGC